MGDTLKRKHILKDQVNFASKCTFMSEANLRYNNIICFCFSARV